jgi:hypothetical protein
MRLGTQIDLHETPLIFEAHAVVPPLDAQRYHAAPPNVRKLDQPQNH